MCQSDQTGYFKTVAYARKIQRILVGLRYAKVKGHAELKRAFPKLHHSKPNGKKVTNGEGHRKDI